MEEEKGVAYVIPEVGKPFFQCSGDTLNGQGGGGSPESQQHHQEQADQGQEIIGKGKVGKYPLGFLVEKASEENQENNGDQLEKEFKGDQ